MVFHNYSARLRTSQSRLCFAWWLDPALLQLQFTVFSHLVLDAAILRQQKRDVVEVPAHGQRERRVTGERPRVHVHVALFYQEFDEIEIARFDCVVQHRPARLAVFAVEICREIFQSVQNFKVSVETRQVNAREAFVVRNFEIQLSFSSRVLVAVMSFGAGHVGRQRLQTREGAVDGRQVQRRVPSRVRNDYVSATGYEVPRGLGKLGVDRQVQRRLPEVVLDVEVVLRGGLRNDESDRVRILYGCDVQARVAIFVGGEEGVGMHVYDVWVRVHDVWVRVRRVHDVWVRVRWCACRRGFEPRARFWLRSDFGRS